MSRSRANMSRLAFLMESDLLLLKIFQSFKISRTTSKLVRRFKSFPKKENSIFIHLNNSVTKISPFVESSAFRETATESRSRMMSSEIATFVMSLILFLLTLFTSCKSEIIQSVELSMTNKLP